MQRSLGAARPRRRTLRPRRVVLAVVVVLAATGVRAASPTSDGWTAAATGAAAMVSLHPEADATVSASRPDTSFGRAGSLRVNGKPRLDAYLRFT
ncbi:MAG TPA: hypothetical protein VG795_00360, partial [Acidimicrobiia bacterium]|nr:hypothetical protein [Acidimicrobiia bacterium]